MNHHGDLIDRANDRAQQLTDDSVADVRRRLSRQSEHPSATECANCGAPIPQARRQALPGVSTCIDCATAAADHNRCGGRP